MDNQEVSKVSLWSKYSKYIFPVVVLIIGGLVVYDLFFKKNGSGTSNYAAVDSGFVFFKIPANPHSGAWAYATKYAAKGLEDVYQIEWYEPKMDSIKTKDSATKKDTVILIPVKDKKGNSVTDMTKPVLPKSQIIRFFGTKDKQ